MKHEYTVEWLNSKSGLVSVQCDHDGLLAVVRLLDYDRNYYQVLYPTGRMVPPMAREEDEWDFWCTPEEGFRVEASRWWKVSVTIPGHPAEIFPKNENEHYLIQGDWVKKVGELEPGIHRRRERILAFGGQERPVENVLCLPTGTVVRLVNPAQNNPILWYVDKNEVYRKPAQGELAVQAALEETREQHAIDPKRWPSNQTTAKNIT